MKLNRFEIWLADLNLQTGTEAGKTRPVLIVQSDLLNKVHPSTLICPLTSNIKSGVTILRVNLEKGTGGTKAKSAIMIDQIRAIDNRRLLKKIGQIPSQIQNKVIENIQIVLGIE